MSFFGVKQVFLRSLHLEFQSNSQTICFNDSSIGKRMSNFKQNFTVSDFFQHEKLFLTCCLSDCSLEGLDAVRDRLDRNGVVPSRLEIGQGEVGVVDDDAAAVTVKRFQLVVRHL